MAAGSEQDLISLTPGQQAAIGDYCNRLLHYDPPGTCIGGALNKNLDFGQIARNYRQSEPNMVVFDDFLRPEALAGLYRFCRESTIWFDVRHPRGYIGAYIEEGFATPLVLQIAEELGVVSRTLSAHTIYAEFGPTNTTVPNKPSAFMPMRRR